MKKFRQVQISRYGGPEVLKTIESPEPIPQKNEVRIHVQAIGINFADILARQGLYLDAPKAPCVVGYEVAGTVEAVGNKNLDALLGKRVFALTHFGGYSEKVILPATQLFLIPDSLDFFQAATLPVNYLTAYQLVKVMGGLQKEEAILIHNAGSGVGLATLAMAKKIGAKTFGTASPGKHDRLRQFGLDHPINYTQNDWFKELMFLTKDQGVELILDPLGGKNWAQSYQALRCTGRLGMFGVSSTTESHLLGKLKFLKLLWDMPWFNPVKLMNQNRAVFGVNLGKMWHESEKIMIWMQAILQGVTDGWIKPHVDKVFPMEQASDAHAYIEARKNFGKVLLSTT